MPSARKAAARVFSAETLVAHDGEKHVLAGGDVQAAGHVRRRQAHRLRRLAHECRQDFRGGGYGSLRVARRWQRVPQAIHAVAMKRLVPHAEGIERVEPQRIRSLGIAGDLGQATGGIRRAEEKISIDGPAAQRLRQTRFLRQRASFGSAAGISRS
ncbi:MAG: hypothetical protein WDN28_13300 [Chthoniobacter sp.]